MSDYTVLNDVSATLKQVLADNIDSLVSSSEIVFQSPTEIKDNTAAPMLSVFLFKAEENTYLKNRKMQHPDHNKLRPSPLPLTLYYLITPFARDRGQEQLIMGKVFQIFHDNPSFRGSLLKEGLEGSSQVFYVTLQPLSFEEMFQLWQSFTEKSFRLSACYKVTPVEIRSTRELDTTRVQEKKNRYHQKSVQEVK